MTSEISDDDLQPLAALNDLLFCPRRCALHRTEGIWVDNVYTVEGTRHHRRVHREGEEELEAGARKVARGLRLRSVRLRLIGVADLVEFRPEPFPVEYKRGKKRRWDNDEVQLCAQALCLEEMLGVRVPAGAIYHIKSRRRREVTLDEALRRRTEQAVAELHALIASARTPPPVVHPKCKHCSLYHLCMPEFLAAPVAYRQAAAALFTVEPD